MIRIQIPSKGLSLLSLALVLLLASCGSPKRYAYLQDVELAKLYNVEHQSKIKVQPGDRLQIAVQSAYPELLAPFTSRGFQTSVPGLASSGNTAVTNEDERTLRSYGYVVDNRGEINFPVLGYLKVGGMTISEVAKFLEDRLKASKYVPDPRVTVQLANFQVYLLGATPVAKATAQGGGKYYIYASQWYQWRNHPCGGQGRVEYTRGPILCWGSSYQCECREGTGYPSY